MKTTLLAFLLMTTVSGGAAFAADVTDGKSETIAVEKIICNLVYVAPAGAQSPDYQAGVDVNGNAVAPADVSTAPAVAVPDYTEVPMTVDLAQRIGVLPAGAEMKLPVANLKLYKNGKVEYNGQDITATTTTLCGNSGKSVVSTAQNNGVTNPVPAADAPAQMRVAPSVTENPPVKNGYPTPEQPEDLVPQPASVAPSSTGPVPKVEYKLQQGTANVTR